MDTFYQTDDRQTGFNKILLLAIGIAILVIAGIIGFLMTRPTTEQVKEQVMEGSLREGSPEFEAITKKIIIFNDAQNTMESPTGLGTITMFVRGNIRNNSDKTIIALEIKVGVLDPFDKVIKEKTVIVIPKYKETIAAQETIPINVPIEGFSKDDDRARVQWKVTAIKVR